jgi:hypothetical protein
MSMEVVNGYVCHNCTDVANAKKGVDPAHPKDGPNGVDAPDSQKATSLREAQDSQAAARRGPAIVLGGQFASASDVSNVTPTPKGETPRYAPGSTLDVSA